MNDSMSTITVEGPMLQQISGEHYRHWLLFSGMQAESENSNEF